MDTTWVGSYATRNSYATRKSTYTISPSFPRHPNRSRFIVFMYRSVVVALLFSSLLLTIANAGPAMAAEPGWSPVVLPTGAYRKRIKSMPIHQRPYRPFHFYGNAVRRNYYRSNSPQSRIIPPATVRAGRPILVPIGG